MRLLLLLITILTLFGAPKLYAAETVFFESLYDVPVMPGLTEITEQGLSFDKVEGRIAHAMALSDTAGESAILAFYASVLPQMGWKEVKPALFIREAEKLEISFEAPEDKIGEETQSIALIRFSLGPVPE